MQLLFSVFLYYNINVFTVHIKHRSVQPNSAERCDVDYKNSNIHVPWPPVDPAKLLGHLHSKFKSWDMINTFFLCLCKTEMTFIPDSEV